MSQFDHHSTQFQPHTHMQFIHKWYVLSDASFYKLMHIELELPFFSRNIFNIYFHLI